MKIDPAKHGWMTAPETRKLMAALGEARFVGRRGAQCAAGLAGDRYRHRRADAAGRSAAGGWKRPAIKVVPTGIDHGTVTAIVQRQSPSK